MYANRRNFRVCYEIGVEEYDGDVRPEVEIRPCRACAIKICLDYILFFSVLSVRFIYGITVII